MKLDSCSKKCIFIGYSEEPKAYTVYDPMKKQVLINHDVVFKESDSRASEGDQETPAPTRPKISIREIQEPPSKTEEEAAESKEEPEEEQARLAPPAQQDTTSQLGSYCNGT